jgi:hypothetical protein
MIKQANDDVEPRGRRVPQASDRDGARSGIAAAAGFGGNNRRRTAVRNGAGTAVGHPGR